MNINHSFSEAYQNVKELDHSRRLYSDRFAGLLVGYLKDVSHYTLVKLKKELSKYNTRTRCWKD